MSLEKELIKRVISLKKLEISPEFREEIFRRTIYNPSKEDRSWTALDEAIEKTSLRGLTGLDAVYKIYKSLMQSAVDNLPYQC